MDIARLLTHGDSDAETHATRRPAAHAELVPTRPPRRRTALDRLREEVKTLEWVAANGTALFQDPEDSTANKSGEVTSMRRHLHNWSNSQGRIALEFRRRQAYVAQLTQYQQSTAAIRKLMRGMELDDWYWKCERWRDITREYYKPFSRAEFGELLNDSMDAIATYKMPKEISGDKPSAFGWRDLRGLGQDQRRVHFQSQKTVCGVNLDDTVAICWNIYQDVHLFKEFIVGERTQTYHNVLQCEKLGLRIAEGIVEEVLVLQLAGTHPGLTESVHAVYLVFLVKTETGYMLGARTVESPDLQRAMRGEGMTDGCTFYWTRWDVTSRDKVTGVSTEFTARMKGFIGATVPGYAKIWVLEGLIALVRLDRMLYGTKPLVLLPASTGQ